MLLALKVTDFGFSGLSHGMDKAAVILEKTCYFMFQSEMGLGV